MVARAIAGEAEATEGLLRASGDADALAFVLRLAAARRALLEVIDFVVIHGRTDPNALYTGSVPYLMLAGNLAAGWQLGRALPVALRQRAAGQDAEFMPRNIAVARFCVEHLLTRVPGLRDNIVGGGGAAVNALEAEAF
jgi:hypothetical protein